MHMSEPRAHARQLVEVVAGLYRWHVRDDRLGDVESDAFAIVQEGHVTLIDPLPIDEAKLQALGTVESIVLTAGNHQRSAWRFRKSLGAKVYAPEGAQGLEEKPDHSYSGGDLLPAGLMAFHAPGPTDAMYALWLDRPISVVFLSDLLMHDGSGTPAFVPAEYQDEPARTRTSIQRIVNDLPAEALCFAHGPPIAKNATAVLRTVLANDHEKLPTVH
jgi:glyoxylase-like metal-dependent hydrolase (beta-lactamase superfamily II)